MSEDHLYTLSRVFSQIAENLAFMFIEPQDDEPLPPPEGPCVMTQMNFKGPFSGSLALAVPITMCPIIAANVLGVDPDDELVVKKPYDALNELLNVTCGNLLTAIAGDEPVFDLTIPQVTQLDEAAWNALKSSPGTLGLVLEEHPVLLRMMI